MPLIETSTDTKKENAIETYMDTSRFASIITSVFRARLHTYIRAIVLEGTPFESGYVNAGSTCLPSVIVA
ncbi:MAG: hypothetical protein NTV00_17150 [Methylococcales bacterium]|nr:hypothetical protein [Methylococcales bacterium]